MSELSLAKITTLSPTTNLTLTTANTNSGNIIFSYANDLISITGTTRASNLISTNMIITGNITGTSNITTTSLLVSNVRSSLSSGLVNAYVNSIIVSDLSNPSYNTANISVVGGTSSLWLRSNNTQYIRFGNPIDDGLFDVYPAGSYIQHTSNALSIFSRQTGSFLSDTWQLKPADGGLPSIFLSSAQGKIGIGQLKSIPAYSIDAADIISTDTTILSGTGANLANVVIISGAIKEVGVNELNPSGQLHIGRGSATSNTAPIKLTSGTVMTTIEPGAIEYDGISLYATANGSYGRATVPLTLYNSGIGTSGITVNTNYAIFPAASDTITLPTGTYLVTLRFRSAVAGSTVSGTANVNIRGGGTAVGSFSWGGTAAILDAGPANSFIVAATTLGNGIVASPASAANPRQYIIMGQGILKVTTTGTIIPSYMYSATLTSGTTTLVADNYMIIQQLDTQSAAAAGPAGSGWG